MIEIWRDIPGYEGKYQVSNTGEIRSLKFGKIKILKQYTDKCGYNFLILSENGKRKNYFVHRSVAMTFIPNPNNLPQVNHKDENKANNCVDNLEWCSRKYNMNYGTRNERASKRMCGENNPNYGKTFSEETKKKMSETRKGKDNPNAKPILMYDREGNFIKRFECARDTNEYFGKKNADSNVSMCLTGRYKTAYGYVFVYAEEIEKIFKLYV